MTRETRKEEPLRMKFDPLVIDDLGAKLYSTLPPIISELIANGYDACAKKIWIELSGTSEDKKIIVTDNGVGMSFKEVDDKYLLIGRKRRKGEEGQNLKCDRFPMGKKGIGKLAFFGIAKKAIIETVSEKNKTIFEMDWGEIQKSSSEKEYKPVYSVEKTSEEDGTKITLLNIDRKSDFDIESLKKSISNYFIFDSEFKVFIKGDKDSDFKEIDNEMRYKQDDRGEDFSWSFPELVEKFDPQGKFPFAKEIRGKIILFNLPVKNNLRGVTLFSRKKLVSIPESFPVQGSSHFFQYLTGWLEIDFVDDLKPDVIATNRSSLNWNDENLEPLNDFLKVVINYIHNEWRRLIKERTVSKIKEKYGIDIAVWRETNINNATIVKNIDRVAKILDDPEKIEESEAVDILGIVHSLAPENADFILWSGLHEKITKNKIIKSEFFAGNYLQAAKEAVSIYNEEVQAVSGRTDDGYRLMEISYGKEPAKLIWVTNKSCPNEKNIEEGQKYLSQGIMVGFKNPAVSHTSRTRAALLNDFSNRNCLDILSTISYLFDRLEKRTKPV